MKIKNFFIKNFKIIYLIQNISKRLILNKDSFLYETGWVESILEGAPVQKEGGYIPWLNYSFFKFLDSRISGEQCIFEYGLGYSSIYFSKRVKQLYSVEHDTKWISKIKSQTEKNHIIYNVSEVGAVNYAQSVELPEINFDIILVDGRDRVSCCVCSFSYLTKSGVLILDDSERDRYKHVFVFMKERGFKELTFTSFKPSMNKLASTTVFYRDNNCLGI